MAKSIVLKRAFKFLALSQDKRVRITIRARAPDRIVKTIYNAALNIERRDLVLKKKQKAAFKKTSQTYRHLDNQKSLNRTKAKVSDPKGRSLPHHPNSPVNFSLCARLGPLQ